MKCPKCNSTKIQRFYTIDITEFWNNEKQEFVEALRVLNEDIETPLLYQCISCNYENENIDNFENADLDEFLGHSMNA